MLEIIGGKSFGINFVPDVTQLCRGISVGKPEIAKTEYFARVAI